jgi:4-oxalocrotonate tautomerase
MVAFEGSEAFRELVWVLIEELNDDSWHIGGQPFFGPPSLMSTQPGPVRAPEGTGF